MSALANNGWKPEARAVEATMPFPETMEEGTMRARLEILRDTIVVLVVQLVFRAMMVLRRWNY
ncbi:MAG: hypothetical protein WBP79_06295 [Candidatus Acidiferrales bacterium]